MPPDSRPGAAPVAPAGEAELDVGMSSLPAPGRPLNEDACLALAPAEEGFPAHLFAVAGGLGGPGVGDAAAHLALDTLHREAARGGLGRPDSWLRVALRAASAAIRERAASTPEARGMQATATVLLLAADQACVGHAGDCRAYLVREGAAEQCTTDHTHAVELMRLRRLTPEEALTHPSRLLLSRSLGVAARLDPDVVRRPLRAGDVWVLCTDGLWSAVPPTEIAAAVRRRPPAEAADRLARAAADRGAADHVSVVVVRIERPGAATPRPPLRRPGSSRTEEG